MKDNPEDEEVLREAGVVFIKAKKYLGTIQLDESLINKYLKDHSIRERELHRLRTLATDPNSTPPPTKDVALQQFVKFISSRVFVDTKRYQFAEYIDEEGFFEMKYSGR